MKFIRNIFDNLQKKVAPGEKLSKYKPVVDAFDTIFFTPSETTKTGSSIRDASDLKRVMGIVVFALIPCLIFGMYNIGYQHFTQLKEGFTMIEALGFGALKIMPLIIVSYVVGLGVEFVFAVLRGHEVNEGFLVSGMLIPLIVPIDLPLWMLAVAVVFAVVIGKEVFGGTGMNIMNPALIARAFLFFAYPTSISGDKVWVQGAGEVDAMSGETILGSLAQGKHFAFEMSDMLIGTIPGSIGETSVIAILIGAAILIFTGVGSWKIMISSLFGASLIGLLFNSIGYNDLMTFPWWQHLMVGGFAFGTVFMATDPVTAAQTEKGKWIYGFLVGVFCLLIRIFNPAYPEGVMLAILFMNVMAPLIDHYVVQANISKRMSRMKLSSKQ